MEAIQLEYDVIIVGAGASGLMAAITVARLGKSVLVIERKDKAGKKILATGNGKCNYTNRIQTPECYRSDDSAFAMKVLSCFDVSRTLAFFEELGIYPKEKEGYYYPHSEQAASVVQVLMMECERLGVLFRFEEIVTEIIKPDFTVLTDKLQKENVPKGKNSIPTSSNDKNNKSKNTLDSKKGSTNPTYMNKVDTMNSEAKKSNRYRGKKLIIATGGCASPQLGSDGSGYQIAKAFGHTIIKPLPALVQLKSSEKYCKTVSGVRTTAVVRAYSENNQIAFEEGELLFTDYGISGIPILQISRFVAKALDQKREVKLQLDFFSEVLESELSKLLHTRIKQNPRKTIEEMMVGLLNHKLNYILIIAAKLDPYKQSGKLSPQEIDTLVEQMKAFSMKITDTNSFENAQVSAGGVSTKEIEPTTMESKQIKGLYLVGELTDVDGTCGGYNLQWAWSTGYLAGTHSAHT